MGVQKIANLLLKTTSGEKLDAYNCSKLRKEIDGITYILIHNGVKVLSFHPLGVSKG